MDPGDRVRPYNVPGKECTVVETDIGWDVDTDGNTIRLADGDTLLEADDGTMVVVPEDFIDKL